MCVCVYLEIITVEHRPEKLVQEISAFVCYYS